MDKLKIYLSKSKAGSMDTLMQVRTILSTYENVEVTEFSGGEYNTKLLHEADIVLLIPPTLPKPYTDTITIGKGQYTEIVNQDTSECYVLVSLDTNQLNIVPYGAVELEVIDEDWKTKYAEIVYLLDDIIPIEEAILQDGFDNDYIIKKSFTSKSSKPVVSKNTTTSITNRKTPMLAVRLIKQ